VSDSIESDIVSFPESERASRIAATNARTRGFACFVLFRDYLRSRLTVFVRAVQRVVHLLVPFRLIVLLDFLKAIQQFESVIESVFE